MTAVTRPTPSTNAAATEMVAGRVQATFITAAEVQPFLKDARVRILGVSSARGSPFVPGVPTIAESGYAGFEAVGWIGIAAPAKTPGPVLDKLNAEMVRILGEADVKEKLNTLAFTPVGDTREQFAAYIKSEIAKWGKAVRDSGAKAD